MGTRHRLLIFYKGKIVLNLYGSYDGFVKIVGRRIFDLLKDPKNVENIKRGCQYLRPITKQELKLANEWMYSISFKPYDVEGNHLEEPYPALAHYHASDALPFLIGAGQLDLENQDKVEEDKVKVQTIPRAASLKRELKEMFMIDEEYGYLIDLDKSVFEVYDCDDEERPSITPNRLQDFQEGRKKQLPICVASYDLSTLASFDDVFPKDKHDAKERAKVKKPFLNES